MGAAAVAVLAGAALASGPAPGGAMPVPTFTPSHAPAPAGTHNAQLSAVSCPAQGACVAAGSYSDAGLHGQGLLEVQSGAGWTATEAPLPPDNAQLTNLYGAACGAVGSCTAVGFYASSRPAAGLIETLAAGSWTAQAAPPPAGAGPSDSIILHAVDCPSATGCEAVGADEETGLVETLSGGTWQPSTVPAPGDAQSGTGMTLYGVSCQAVGTCTAVGAYTNTAVEQVAGAEVEVGGVWSVLPVPLPADAAGSGQEAGLDSVSCAAAGSCVATGYYLGQGQQETGLIETLSGGTWTALEAPSPAGLRTDRLYSVTCPATGSCLAGGAASDPSGNGQAVTESLDGGGWTPAVAPLPGDIYPTPSANLAGTACSGPTICQAVGGYVDADHYRAGLIETPPSTPGAGAWLAGSKGAVYGLGGAMSLGSLPGLGISVNDVVGMSPTADDQGYVLAGADGGAFTFGDASFEGSLPGLGLVTDHVVGVAMTPTGKGYWMADSSGGVYAFGDAAFLGSLPSLGVAVHDIVGISATPDGGGFWLTGADGGVFALGDAPYLGSLPALGAMVHTIVDLGPTPSGGGYWLTDTRGATTAFGDAPAIGSLAAEGVHVTDIRALAAA
jgi:hypothetical protein